jgi:predicted aspartyl protease
MSGLQQQERNTMYKQELNTTPARFLDSSDGPSLTLLIGKSKDHPSIQVEAMFDSGFDEFISLPSDLTKSLGMACWAYVVNSVGDGWMPVHCIAKANVLFAGQEKMVPVVVTDDPFGRVVVGARFLKRFKTRLIVDNEAAKLIDQWGCVLEEGQSAGAKPLAP